MKVMCIKDCWVDAIPYPVPSFGEVCTVTGTHESRGKTFYFLAEYPPASDGTKLAYQSDFFMPLDEQPEEQIEELQTATA